MNTQSELTALHEKLGRKQLSRTFAKIEILVGLCAVSAAIWLATGILAPALFVLGSYLVLAGHRSHLYQSNNETAAYLAGEIRALKQTEHPGTVERA